MDNYLFNEESFFNTPGIQFVKDDSIRLWQIFYKEHRFLFSGVYIKMLVRLMKYLYVGVTIEEIKEIIKNFEFNYTLMNGICVALLHFSDRGAEFFDEFYVLDIPEDLNEISLAIEKGITRSLTRVKFM